MCLSGCSHGAEHMVVCNATVPLLDELRCWAARLAVVLWRAILLLHSGTCSSSGGV